MDKIEFKRDWSWDMYNNMPVIGLFPPFHYEFPIDLDEPMIERPVWVSYVVFPYRLGYLEMSGF